MSGRFDAIGQLDGRLILRPFASPRLITCGCPELEEHMPIDDKHDDLYTKADFRAMRERLGLTQQNIADMAGVTVLSVKKWEKLSGNPIPLDVQYLLLSLEERFESGVDAMLADFPSAVGDRGGDSATVEIIYFRSQEDYNKSGRDEGPYGYVNAMSREIARSLEERGVPVRFIYPEERSGRY